MGSKREASLQVSVNPINGRILLIQLMPSSGIKEFYALFNFLRIRQSMVLDNFFFVFCAVCDKTLHPRFDHY